MGISEPDCVCVGGVLFTGVENRVGGQEVDLEGKAHDRKRDGHRNEKHINDLVAVAFRMRHLAAVSGRLLLPSEAMHSLRCM